MADDGDESDPAPADEGHEEGPETDAPEDGSTDPDGEDAGGADGTNEEADAFDEEAFDADVGADGAGDGEGLFEEEFSSAFEGAGGGDVGFDGEAFDADADSSLQRITLGIDGLDEMIRGGVPERSLLVAIGAPGTGKTTFGLQFLEEALVNGERAVFITLEESRENLLQTAEEKGWEFQRHVEEGRLAILDFDPVEMANSLTSIRNELPTLVDEFGADRLVLDSVSLLEMMYDDQGVRRTEIYDFTKALKAAGVTTMLTSEASERDPFASRYGVIEYLTDAVFVLRYVRSDDFRETRLAIEIQKIRDAHHSRETKPYEITDEGIEVYRQANIF